jgi:acetate kinase
MKSPAPCVLAVNSGSSSIRFAVFEAGGPAPCLAGKIDRIGLDGTRLRATGPQGATLVNRSLSGSDHGGAVERLIDWIESQPVFPGIRGVGHRIVHGLRHTEPEPVTRRLLGELRRITRFDPDHMPREIALIEGFQRRHPKLRQVACFDTAFHRTMPRIARLLPIPRRFAAKGVERYGFHGLSYTYLMEELSRLDPAGAKGRVVLAHLGNGASLAAVRAGRSIDTSMGFTPAAGLVMSTRTGDLDPGVGFYMAQVEGMTATRFQQMVNRESGLLGISGTSPDLRDLLARERRDARARDAVGVFCYQVTKWIGAYAAALGGLDTLVFSAGIGENAPIIRRRICAGLGFIGLRLDPGRNARNAPVISARGSHVTVRVIRTDEELMIARSVARLLRLHSAGKSKK